MSQTHHQLPLNFKQTSTKSFADFVIADNQGLINSLHSFVESQESLFYLWGEAGAGKSHLLQAFVNGINDKGQSAVVITHQEISVRSNVSLIQMFDCICIDNVENMAGDEWLEESLFLWINEVRQARKKIILSSQIANSNPMWQLPDLRSRLQWGRTHQISALVRDQVLLVFQQQAQQKGLIISDKTTQYLYNNCPINMKFLSQLLQALDQATLVEKKSVTTPLLKKILAELVPSASD